MFQPVMLSNFLQRIFMKMLQTGHLKTEFYYFYSLNQIIGLT